MADLISAAARICTTAGGILVHHDKVLLVKHKKLGIWLAPGGHVELNELPHRAAEREVFEETNIKVRTVSIAPMITSEDSQYLPVPLAVNLHWISQENYHNRLMSSQPDIPHSTATWPRGCEQHLGYIYLVRPLGGLTIRRDPNESDDIGWFTFDQIDSLLTKPDLKSEIKLAFQISQQIFN